MRARFARTALVDATASVAFWIALAVGPALPQTAVDAPPPALRDTGLYADFDRREINPTLLPFAPQYPLWTDGAAKRRWISLPPGTAIDATDPDNWVFPVGTRLWKEFAFDGHPVETRFIQRLPDRWLFAAYEWSADGSEAMLAPERGRLGAYPLEGGQSYTIPAVSDCHVCHESGRTPVLGFSALQLSPDRDPDGLHASPPPEPVVNLATLVDAGLLVGLPLALQQAPPRIDASTPAERTALGYLHGNCGHCHNADSPLRNLGLFLRHVTGAAVEPAVASTVGRPIRTPAPGQSPDALLRIDPGHPDRSALVQRISSRYAALQMPPLGTGLADPQAIELVRRWIAGLKDVHAANQEEGQRR